jgi:hypothetical protein
MLLILPKISVNIDDTVVEGEFVYLQPNGMRVRLIKPFDGKEIRSLHRPYFAMPYGQFCSEEGEVTELGMFRAKQLVMQLYLEYQEQTEKPRYVRAL